MKSEERYNQVLDFILEIAGEMDCVDRDHLRQKSLFTHAGLDSLDMMVIVMEVEKRYDIYLGEDKYSTDITFAEFARRVVEVIKESR